MPYADEPPVLDRIPHPVPEGIAALPLPAAADPLDGVLGENPPEHTWVGMAYVWMMYAVGAGGVISALELARDDPDAGSRIAVLLPMFLFMPVAILWLARAIEKFRLHGFGFAMFVLVPTILGAVAKLLEADSLVDSLLPDALFGLQLTCVFPWAMKVPAPPV
jgi:hypothetical protein